MSISAFFAGALYWSWHINEMSKYLSLPNLSQHFIELTYLPTPWIRVLLEKLPGSQLNKKFLHFMESKVRYCFYKCLPPIPILSQINTVHAPSSHFLKVRLIIILPSMPVSYKRCLSLRFPLQKPVCTFSLPHTCYIPRPSFFSI